MRSSTRQTLTTAASSACWPTSTSYPPTSTAFPTDQHRLLIGCDIFFLKVPQEVLAFTWQPDKQAKVLYMADVNSFAGALYKLRYYKPPILEGLLGDFYCLAPGVRLAEDAIRGCLKMIDDWPANIHRWEPMAKTLMALLPASSRQPPFFFNPSGGSASTFRTLFPHSHTG